MLEIVLIAYFTNAACTLSKLFPKRHSLDFGTNLLGSHKTLEGFLLGLNAGLLIGVFISDFRTAFFVSILALCGDLLGSFIKRLLKFKPGTGVLFLDQLGFLLMVFLFVKINFFTALFYLGITMIIHKLANIVAYKLHLKNVNY